MTVEEKIEQKRVEMKQERDKAGKYKKSHDPFLLWGEYPHGWSMIKDLILCLLLMNALIGQLKQIDLSGMMAEAPEIAQVAQIQPAEASTGIQEEKTAETAKSEATTTAYSEIDSCHYEGCLMASGKKAYVGAVACPRSMPLGTRIKIDGNPYVCEDRTAITYDGRFDIFMGYGEESYQKAIRYGKQIKTIEVVQ